MRALWTKVRYGSARVYYEGPFCESGFELGSRTTMGKSPVSHV